MPFTAELWRQVAYAVLSFVVLAPLILGLGINASLQVPGVSLLSLLAYVGVFIAVNGARFERWRTSSLLRIRIANAARRDIRRELAYLLVNIPLGCLSIGLVVGWIVISIRNVLFYPVFGWTSYPDPSWGGPTPVGAVGLHFAVGLLVLFAGPWAIGSVTRIQGSLVQHLLAGQAS